MLRGKFTIVAVKVLIPATILLIPAYLIRFDVFGIPTNILEILVLASFGLAIFDNWFKRGSASLNQNGPNPPAGEAGRPSLKPIFLPVALILAGLLVSTLVNENYRVGFGIIKSWFVVPLVFGWVLMREIKRTGTIREVLKWLYLGIFLVALASLTYYFSGNLTYDGRLKAFYLSPNHLAMYLAPGVVIGIYLIQSILSQLKNKILAGRRLLAYASRHHPLLLFYAVSFLIILISLYFTYSYAAWLAAVLSLIIVAIVKNKKINKHVILVSSIILLLIFISQWNTEKIENLKNFTRSSLESRMTIWQSAVQILKNNWLWGIGPGNFQNKYLEYQKHFPPYLEWAVPQPHNLYLAFWLQSGILGFTGFTVLIYKWLKNLTGIIRRQKNGWEIAAVLLSIMFYILLHGLVDTTYWKNDLAMVFWVIFSLGIIISRERIDKNSPSL